jgi:hypothetical protein
VLQVFHVMSPQLRLEDLAENAVLQKRHNANHAIRADLIPVPQLVESGRCGSLRHAFARVPARHIEAGSTGGADTVSVS